MGLGMKSGFLGLMSAELLERLREQPQNTLYRTFCKPISHDMILTISIHGNYAIVKYD